MRQGISPAVAVVAVLIVVAAVALWFWRGTASAGGKTDDINKAIAAGVAGGPGNSGAPPGINPGALGGGPAGPTTTLGAPPPGVGSAPGTMPPPGPPASR